MKSEKIIGIVGGVGPYAGLDLARKIFDQTKAKSDQEHLSVALLSLPGDIADRTSFLLGNTKVNPAEAVFEIIRKLEQIGTSVVGIPCNTMHSPHIFDVLLEKLKSAKSTVEFVNMVDEVAKFIQQNHPKIKDIGLLCTTGTYKTKVYQHYLEPKGFNIILPDKNTQENVVHRAIYDMDYGIKARSNPVTEAAKKNLLDVIDWLQKQGAEAVIFGCTEIPLAIDDEQVKESIMIDPTLILARALIRQVNPEKLKPLEK